MSHILRDKSIASLLLDHRCYYGGREVAVDMTHTVKELGETHCTIFIRHILGEDISQVIFFFSEHVNIPVQQLNFCSGHIL